MCDYSLTRVQTRPAVVGDKLKTTNFGTGTIGFSPVGDNVTAVCVLPGTELAFDKPFQAHGWSLMDMFVHAESHGTVAIFRQVEKDNSHTHHDALETPDGKVVKLTNLREGQTATVLQLPATPKTEKEAQEQKRVEWVG